ncbi:MAG: CDP-alcohol phosphatidyltransferase family protein [Acidobacteria bacterium]|nr:CDP-alcohol phosphatidyltransferase family protein [Acidobacteriota bacterium]
MSASPTSFRQAKRQHQSILAGVEKKALVWMAERLPAVIHSDHLTLLGFAAMLGAGLAYWLSAHYPWALFMVSAMLVINWLGDSLDGTLARVRNKTRPRYGFYVDHVVDAFSTFFLLGGMALSGYMTPLIALGALIAYLMINIEVYLATYTIGIFHLSFFKFGPTELRLLLIIGNTVIFFKPYVRVFGPPLLLFDIAGAIGIIGMGLILIITAIRHTRQLYREETRP